MKRKMPFSLPDKERMSAIGIFGLIAAVTFGIIYGYCNKIAAASSVHYPMYADFELKIPLVPWMIYPYVSLNLLFVVAAFVLKKNAVKGYCLSLAAAALVAGVFFYFFPAKLGFQRVDVAGFEGLYRSMYEIDNPHNLFPSLHVTYSSLSIWAMINQSKTKWFHWMLWIWLLLITASVVLVHQHHLFDVFTGFILAAIVYYKVYKHYAKA